MIKNKVYHEHDNQTRVSDKITWCYALNLAQWVCSESVVFDSWLVKWYVVCIVFGI